MDFVLIFLGNMGGNNIIIENIYILKKRGCLNGPTTRDNQYTHTIY